VKAENWYLNILNVTSIAELTHLLVTSNMR